MQQSGADDNRTWFSHFFGVDIPQYELPFVDFDINSDVALYIDPYAITKDPSDLAGKCQNSIFSYFQCLLNAIHQSDGTQVRRLIHGKLSEPNEIHLGVGKFARSGRGLGDEQERSLVTALTNSEAARVGAVQTIQEFELHVPGIGSDKISDLIANIILAHLAEFTEQVCAEYGISTRSCAVSFFWNDEREEWDGDYFNLPVHGTHSYILVPKRFVRRERDLMNHREFYDKFVLEILKRELLSADDSLVEALKNGKRRVTKKSIREDERFTLSKEYISQFIIENPDVIADYRQVLREGFNPIDPAYYSGKAREDDPKIAQLIDNLSTIKAGKANANVYHDIVFELIQFIFDYAFVNFDKEYRMDAGRSRIDIIADNLASGGVFFEIRNELNATSIPIECKNYNSDLGNQEFNQITDRLSSTTSRFGILFCRTINDSSDMSKHQSMRWLRQDKIILLIDDNLLIELADLRLRRDYHEIDLLVRRLIRDIKYWN